MAAPKETDRRISLQMAALPSQKKPVEPAAGWTRRFGISPEFRPRLFGGAGLAGIRIFPRGLVGFVAIIGLALAGLRCFWWTVSAGGVDAGGEEFIK